MKSFVQIVLLLVTFASASLAGTGLGMYRDDRYPGKCVINDKLILSPNESAPHPDFCGEITCRGMGLAEIVSCPPQDISCETGISLNPTAAYPGCCLQIC